MRSRASANCGECACAAMVMGPLSWIHAATPTDTGRLRVASGSLFGNAELLYLDCTVLSRDLPANHCRASWSAALDAKNSLPLPSSTTGRRRYKGQRRQPKVKTCPSSAPTTQGLCLRGSRNPNDECPVNQQGWSLETPLYVEGPLELGSPPLLAAFALFEHPLKGGTCPMPARQPAVVVPVRRATSAFVSDTGGSLSACVCNATSCFEAGRGRQPGQRWLARDPLSGSGIAVGTPLLSAWRQFGK